MTRIRQALLAGLAAVLLPLSARGNEDFLVRSWQSEDGLPGNTVSGVVQAADGYLWIDTD